MTATNKFFGLTFALVSSLVLVSMYFYAADIQVTSDGENLGSASPRSMGEVNRQEDGISTEEGAALVFFRNCVEVKDPLKGRAGCYAKQMEEVSYSRGSKFAHDVLLALQKIDPSAQLCHFIAHGIGWGSYKRGGAPLHRLLAESDPACGYGAQMGIIELHTMSLPEGKLTGAEVPSLCGPNPKGNCNHAVGHILLLEAGGNIEKAIDLCSSLEDQDQNFHCLSGMFMERIIPFNLIDHGLAPSAWANWTKRLMEQEELCRSFDGRYSAACWRELAHPAFHYFSKDPKAVLNFCNSAPSYEAAKICKIHALPELMSIKNYDLMLLRDMCAMENEKDPEFTQECFLNLVSIKINFFKENAEDIISYCSSFNYAFAYSCFQVVGQSLKTYAVSEGRINEICAFAPEEFKQACRGW